MHYGNTTFSYYNAFKDYMKADEVVSEGILIISLMLELKNSYQKKAKKYLIELFEEWGPEHLKQIDEYFDD